MARSSVIVLAMLLAIVGAAQARPSIAGAVLIRQPGATDGAATPGSATLRILARSGERVREVALDTSSGNAAFDAAALNTVKRWRYVPALTGNSTKPEWLLVRLVYQAEPAPRLARLSVR
jgi:TonB family protein